MRFVTAPKRMRDASSLFQSFFFFKTALIYAHYCDARKKLIGHKKRNSRCTWNKKAQHWCFTFKIPRQMFHSWIWLSGIHVVYGTGLDCHQGGILMSSFLGGLGAVVLSQLEWHNRKRACLQNQNTPPVKRQETGVGAIRIKRAFCSAWFCESSSKDFLFYHVQREFRNNNAVKVIVPFAWSTCGFNSPVILLPWGWLLLRCKKIYDYCSWHSPSFDQVKGQTH